MALNIPSVKNENPAVKAAGITKEQAKLTKEIYKLATADQFTQKGKSVQATLEAVIPLADGRQVLSIHKLYIQQPSTRMVVADDDEQS